MLNPRSCREMMVDFTAPADCLPSVRRPGLDEPKVTLPSAQRSQARGHGQHGLHCSALSRLLTSHHDTHGRQPQIALAVLLKPSSVAPLSSGCRPRRTNSWKSSQSSSPSKSWSHSSVSVKLTEQANPNLTCFLLMLWQVAKFNTTRFLQSRLLNQPKSCRRYTPKAARANASGYKASGNPHIRNSSCSMHTYFN